jgi:TonB-dependent SusC/RagA subfamily outer membrane receptor
LRQTVIELRQAAMDQRQAAIDYELAMNGPNGNTTLKGDIALKPSSGQKDNPLFVIDGVISSDINLKDINPNNIISINVLKGEKATAKYAEKGANGVIEITTKKQ